MRPPTLLLAFLLATAALGAEPDAEACKASLSPWVGKDASALEKQWGPPAEVSKWRGGTKRVFDFAKRSPVEAPGLTPLPGSPNPDRLDLPSEGAGSSTTSPFHRISPASRLVIPSRTFSNVVFPDPIRPVTTVNEPRSR